METFHEVLRDEKISSPLKVFGIAKKQIGKIYDDILNYVTEASTHINDVNTKCPSALNENEFKSILAYKSKIKGICEVLKRDRMKVVFFGRTSNGKSTVVNAMLRDKVLPSGIGHTTSCFLQVEASQMDDAYLVIEGSNEKQNVESVSHLAHALNHEKQLNENELVHIYWPKDKCDLLRDDVALVDSPGVDITPDLDDWIDAHCTDADVFVLVVNAESTLMVTEKNFFHKVSSKLSKPNIFILNNRWDVSANEIDILDKVRKQHMERATDFLVNELKVCTVQEASTRIFFVSAKEVLQTRIQEKNGLSLKSENLVEGYSKRYMEFEEFEHRFEECISKSAIKTKFLNHSQQGKHLITETCKIIDQVYHRCQEQKNVMMHNIQQHRDEIKNTQEQFDITSINIKNRIHQTVNNVKDEVCKSLRDEIRRLSDLVDKFDCPFEPNPSALKVYKRELHSHVESGLGRNMQTKLSTALNINLVQNEMVEAISSLLPAEICNINLKSPHLEPFQILNHLIYDKIYEDFHEQLEYNFSWGVSELLNWVSPLKVCPNSHPESQMPNTLSRIVEATVKKIAVRIVLGVIILNYYGTNLIIIISATSCLYLYGLLMWTTDAKKKEFKRQYVNHITIKLDSIVGDTSISCSHQVDQKLSTNFARLSKLVDRYIIDLNEKISKINSELKTLDKSIEILKTFRNKANPLKAKLKQFGDTFLY